VSVRWEREESRAYSPCRAVELAVDDAAAAAAMNESSKARPRADLKKPALTAWDTREGVRDDAGVVGVVGVVRGSAGGPGGGGPGGAGPGGGGIAGPRDSGPG
jgi:hypothetical protein